MIVLQAHAKINLWLRVLGREKGSGYHRIDAAFCRLQLADELSIETTSGGFDLTVEGADLGDPGDNLVSRAADLFARATGQDPALRIRLVKNIPAGAGLGGGSSDAAATLLALNRLHHAPLDAHSLHEIGRGLGADVPFFLTGAAAAVGAGRGDELTPIPAPPPATVLIVWPGIPIPTGDAYRALARGTAPAPAPPASKDDLGSWEAIAARAGNDFESVVGRWIPDFTAIRDALLEAGARFALLAGSGSAVFGLFDRTHDDGGADALRSRFPQAQVFETATGVEPLPGVDSPPGPG